MQQILQHYYPRLDELDPQAIQETRQRLRDHLRTQFKDLDMDPNSVFGDLWLTPAATHIAALDVALSRYKSDLDLANVAEGIIWDCDFVEKYIQNFAPAHDWDLASYGVARLVFNQNDQVELPRHILFEEGEAVYRLKLAEQGPLYIRPQGTQPTPGVNEAFLVASNTAWIVDIPLVGSLVESQPPVQGTQFTVSDPVEGLVSATALSSFASGEVTLKLSTLARITRETTYAATPGTKGGMSSFFRRRFPSYIGAHTTTMDDPVMKRPIGIRPVDVYSRSSQTFFDGVNVRLKLEEYSPTEKFFEGELFFPAIPILLGKVVSPNTPDVNISDDVKFFYKSNDEVRAPGWTGAYSPLQRIWVRLEMPVDPVTNDPLLDTQIINGEEIAAFNIPFYQDPGFRAAADILQSEENRPVYTDLLPRLPLVVFINSITVRYKRKPGTKVKLQHARNELREYVNDIMYPQVFSDARVADIMFFAGAQDVLNIGISASVRYSPAHFMFTDDPDTVGFAAAVTSAVPAPVTNINTTEGLKILYNPESTAAASPENMRYFLLPENIVFEEV